MWFGNVTAGNDVERLRAFYSRPGFTVLADGYRVRRSLAGSGRRLTDAPAFVFYKMIARQS